MEVHQDEREAENSWARVSQAQEQQELGWRQPAWPVRDRARQVSPQQARELPPWVRRRRPVRPAAREPWLQAQEEEQPRAQEEAQEEPPA
jgi:hypothetical protein